MMTCEEARQLLDAFIDDELPTHDREDVTTHLADCAECRREAEEIEQTREAPCRFPPWQS